MARKKKNRLTVLGRATPRVVEHFAPEGDYKETRTKFTTRVETERDSVVFTDRYIGPGLLALVNMVRIEVQSRLKEDQIIPCQQSPEYHKLGALQKKTNAVEVDLTKAYLTAAFKIGAISERTHDRLLTTAKDTRLMVLGSLATQKTVSIYIMGAEVESKHVQDQELTQVWKWIVAEVDKTMREVAAELKKGFLYYWCDAVMVKADYVAAAQRAMSERGYGSKTRMVTLQKNGRKVYFMDGRQFPTRTSAPARFIHQKGAAAQ